MKDPLCGSSDLVPAPAQQAMGIGLGSPYGRGPGHNQGFLPFYAQWMGINQAFRRFLPVGLGITRAFYRFLPSGWV